MTDRDRVLRTIRALLEKTVANGCPVEEAMAAHAKAQTLIDTYQVSHEELYGTGPGRRWQEPKPEPAEPKQQQAEPEGAAEAAKQANSHDTNDPDFRSSKTAWLGNALYRAFSVLAAVLSFAAALFARARRSPKYLKFSGAGALLIVGGIVLLFIIGGIVRFRLDAQHREAPPQREAAEVQRETAASEPAERASATSTTQPPPAAGPSNEPTVGGGPPGSTPTDRINWAFAALGPDPDSALPRHRVLAYLEDSFALPGRKEETPGPTPTDRTNSAAITPSAPQTVAAQRAALLEQDPNDPRGKHFDGTVTWRTETVSPGPGLAPMLEVHGDIAIPERHMTVALALRHNTDKALPASHTIQIMFHLPPNFPGDGIVSVPGIFAKPSELATGPPLAGISVKVTDDYFLLGLSADPTLQQRNVQLLKDQKWFDIAIVYKNNVKAILAVERGPPGNQVFADAFSAWGEPPHALPPATVQTAPASDKGADLGPTIFNKLFGQPARDMPLASPTPGGSTSDDTGKYAVQLASEWNAADAEAAYRALQGRYGSVLGDQQPRIVRIEQSNKGVYYRVMVGQFPTALEATQFCNSLKALGGSCTVQCDRC